MRRTWMLGLLLVGSLSVADVQGQAVQEHLRRIEATTPKDPLFSQWAVKEDEGQETFQWGGWTANSLVFFDNDDNSDAVPDAVENLYISDNRIWGRWDREDGSHMYGRLRYLNFNFDLGPGALRPDLPNERLDLDILYYDTTVLEDVGLRLGRQYIRQGRGFTLNGNYDGVLAEHTSGNWDFVGYAVRSLPNDIDIDPLNTHPRRFFYAANASYLTTWGQKVFGYFLAERDNSRQPGAIPAAVQRFDLDVNFYALGTTGDFYQDLSYYSEFILEKGSVLALGPTAPRIDVDASAAYAEVVYHPAWFGDPQFIAEYARGSGDTSRLPGLNTVSGSGALGFDANFVGFGRYDFGIGLNPRLSNIVIHRVGATWKPWKDKRYFKNFTIGGKLSRYQKDDPNGGISDLQAILADDDVGTGLDLFFGWRPLSDLSVVAQYGKFSPGDAYPIGTRDDTNNLFLNLTWSY